MTVAEDSTVAKLGRRARRLREEFHPESIRTRREKAVRDRNVTVEPERDGMAWLGAYLPAEQAYGIYNRVDSAARSVQCPEETRTLAQLRADVFTDVLTHTCAGAADAQEPRKLVRVSAASVPAFRSVFR
ncbi:DUF222 domain-containing protein [Arthrobacter sp. H5]|uniref:DUF222 domain-containing protein n=1 Tax=Arthrobacter sp. H5 TaxID=1267973 RepID=UPI00047F513E|nr:DUF222 domain-containing protein [Arthrobacter sp. H5]